MLFTDHLVIPFGQFCPRRNNMSYSESFDAIIPVVHRDHKDVRQLLALLERNGLVRETGPEGTHFWVSRSEGGPSHTIEDMRPYYKGSVLLERVLRQNLICLTWMSEYDSHWDGEDNSQPIDPVALAEQIPTLILQEVLAQRLAE